MIGREIVRERHYRYYDIRDELWDSPCPDDSEPLLMRRTAYTKTGDWIGSSKNAYHLVHKFGIQQFEKTDPEHCVCSIGFSPEHDKWYGWSHRAIHGFTIGSTCKKGDIHYIPDSFFELVSTCDQKKGDMCRGHAYYIMEPEDPNNPSGAMVPQGPAKGIKRCTIENCIHELGRGEWVAETTEDAKLMATHFAMGVS